MSLTVVQERAAELIAQGLTHEEIAKKLDVVRLTVTRWNSDPEFKELVAMFTRQRFKGVNERLVESIPMAVDTIIKIAKTGGNKETVNSQLRAAMYILENAKKIKIEDKQKRGSKYVQEDSENISEDEYEELLNR